MVSEAKAGNGDAPPQENPPQEEPELPPEAEGDAADDARVAANNLPINNLPVNNVPDPAIPLILPIMRSEDDEEDENGTQADGVESNSRMESTDAQTDGTLNSPSNKPPALKGTQSPETAWATKTGRAYDRRFREFWHKFEGETIGDGIEVAAVNRRLAEGVQPDLVLINRNKKVIEIHDLTSEANPAHLAKGERYVKYFKEKYPGFEVEYTEGYWRGKENSVEALNKSGTKYLPGETKP
ncbi:MAG: hypothetical protein U0996_07160 [Planctomycetaceae bacterium]